MVGLTKAQLEELERLDKKYKVTHIEATRDFHEVLEEYLTKHVCKRMNDNSIKITVTRKQI